VVNILKLSANLRKMTAPLLEDIERDVEIVKLDKLLIMPDDSLRDHLAYTAAANATVLKTEVDVKKVVKTEEGEDGDE
jgi:hypothetical protein